jgi:predicted molibdopterin-dependent oxidoreductase YjgC
VPGTLCPEPEVFFEPMSEPIRITVDDKPIDVEAGTNLLSACLDNGIYIPHLCYLGNLKPPAASCRLCFVEIEGCSGPVPACTAAVESPLTVKTDTPAVRRLQRAGLRLLLSVHRIECKSCPANRRCELQRLAKFLKVGLRPGTLVQHLKQPEIDSSHPCLDYYPNRCVLCGKCVNVCRSEHRDVVLTFARRGFDTVVSYYGRSSRCAPSCDDCVACVEICPVAALRKR